MCPQCSCVCVDCRAVVISSIAPNVPSTDERFDEFIFIDDSLEVIGVSLREIVLGSERLITLTLPARVIVDLVNGSLSFGQKISRATGTDEELGIIELFLKRKSGTREPRDKDDSRLGRITRRVSRSEYRPWTVQTFRERA